MTTAHHILSLVLIATLVTLSGCCGTDCMQDMMEGMEVMDEGVDELVTVLQDCDRDGFNAIASDDLQSEVDDAKFKEICTKVKGFGELNSKTRTNYGFHNSTMKGTYTMEFASGDVELEYNTENDKVVMFNFTEGTGVGKTKPFKMKDLKKDKDDGKKGDAKDTKADDKPAKKEADDKDK